MITEMTRPDTLLSGLSDRALMRGFGYVDGRWHDQGMLSFTAEYRWPVWNNSNIDDVGLDAYIFVDYGQVFGETNEISTRSMTTSFDSARFFVRMEIGHSKDDTVFRLSADQVFQFTRGGFFDGAKP